MVSPLGTAWDHLVLPRLGERVSLEGFTCLFQMTNGTNHLLTCLLAFSLAILDSCLFDPFFPPVGLSFSY